MISILLRASVPAPGFLGFGLDCRFGEIAIGINMGRGLRQHEPGPVPASPALRESLAFYRKHFMRHAMLVMRRGVDSRRRRFVPWLERTARHSLDFRQGNTKKY